MDSEEDNATRTGKTDRQAPRHRGPTTEPELQAIVSKYIGFQRASGPLACTEKQRTTTRSPEVTAGRARAVSTRGALGPPSRASLPRATKAIKKDSVSRPAATTKKSSVPHSAATTKNNSASRPAKAASKDPDPRPDGTYPSTFGHVVIRDGHVAEYHQTFN